MPRTCLLIIDAQVDFHEGGSLAVPGANADSTRLAEFIRENLADIDEIILTLDSHNPDHIAHSSRWVNDRGDHPPLFSQISSQDVKNGVWKASDPALQEKYLVYTKKLEEKGRFILTIWPNHCIIGTPGHQISPILQPAVEEWEKSRGEKATIVKKGMNNNTEMYSVMQAEVPDPSDTRTDFNLDLQQRLSSFDKVLVCGQALSHCVNYTVRDLLERWSPRDPSDLCLIVDGCSPVPGFERESQLFLDYLSSCGARIIKFEEARSSLAESSRK